MKAELIQTALKELKCQEGTTPDIKMKNGELIHMEGCISVDLKKHNDCYASLLKMCDNQNKQGHASGSCGTMKCSSSELLESSPYKKIIDIATNKIGELVQDVKVDTDFTH